MNKPTEGNTNRVELRRTGEHRTKHKRPNSQTLRGETIEDKTEQY